MRTTLEIFAEDRDVHQSFATDNIEVVCSLEGLKMLHELFEMVDEDPVDLRYRKEDGYLWHKHLQDFIRRYDARLYSDFVINVFE